MQCKLRQEYSKMPRLLIVVFILIAVFWLNYQSREHPQLKFNALSDRVLHPFDTRLRYRIDDVDPRFKLSIEQVRQISEQAATIWNDGTGQQYIVYDPNAQLTIHLIYDERQFESEQQRAHLNQLKMNQQEWINKKQELDQMEQQLAFNKQSLDLKKQELNQQIDNYNHQVLLAKQNATDHDRQYFQQQQYELQKLVQKLRLEIDNFNQNIVELNRKIDSLNSLDQQLDSSVKLYRQRFQPRLFHKGLFNGKQILIYEFQSENDLRLTLAHEFGHALGLSHHNDPQALMYPLMQDQDLNDFRLKPADLELLQSVQ